MKLTRKHVGMMAEFANGTNGRIVSVFPGGLWVNMLGASGWHDYLILPSEVFRVWHPERTS